MRIYLRAISSGPLVAFVLIAIAGSQVGCASNSSDQRPSGDVVQCNDSIVSWAENSTNLPAGIKNLALQSTTKSFTGVDAKASCTLSSGATEDASALELYICSSSVTCATIISKIDEAVSAKPGAYIAAEVDEGSKTFRIDRDGRIVFEGHMRMPKHFASDMGYADGYSVVAAWKQMVETEG